MLGRVAYHDPYFLAQGDGACSATTRRPARAPTCCAMIPYAAAQLARGVALRAIARHVLGLSRANGRRRFRQILSDSAKLRDAGPELFEEALAAVEPVDADAVGA
jgi:tRNA-dihydrouridine synthase A